MKKRTASRMFCAGTGKVKGWVHLRSQHVSHGLAKTLAWTDILCTFFWLLTLMDFSQTRWLTISEYAFLACLFSPALAVPYEVSFHVRLNLWGFVHTPCALASSTQPTDGCSFYLYIRRLCTAFCSPMGSASKCCVLESGCLMCIFIPRLSFR